MSCSTPSSPGIGCSPMGRRGHPCHRAAIEGSFAPPAMSYRVGDGMAASESLAPPAPGDRLPAVTDRAADPARMSLRSDGRRAASATSSPTSSTCRRCPRLVAWREEVAQTKVARHRSSVYWGRPVPGFGDPAARLLLVGLAPAAHGGNRTGRVFTGDNPGGSGELLFEALHRAGFSPRPRSSPAGDGLVLQDAYIAAVNRCAPPDNRPTPSERDHCLPYLGREFGLLTAVRVIVTLGGFAWDGSSARSPPTATRPVQGRASATARRPPSGPTCSWAAITPASRTRSQDVSRQACSTMCCRGRGPCSTQADGRHAR